MYILCIYFVGLQVGQLQVTGLQVGQVGKGGQVIAVGQGVVEHCAQTLDTFSLFEASTEFIRWQSSSCK